MSLSRSPICTHRPGSSRSSVDCFRLSNHRMLSFFSMGTRVGLIFFLSAAVPFEFLAGPELDRRQSEWQALGRYHEARMHQDAANRVRSEAARLVSSAVYALGYAGRL